MEKLRLLLSKPDYLSLTTDLWKDKIQQYFLCLTVHFFDKNLNFHSLRMSFKKFKTSHHAHFIKPFILNEINKLNILDKIVGITTDNESCVIKACQQLHANCVRISCQAHNLNLAVTKGLKLWQNPEK
jgi:hypothetical protein